jgi:hypothetical protein
MALRRVTASTDAGRAAREALRNLTRDPMVSILIDAYDDDWAKMWWVRLRGTAASSAAAQSVITHGSYCGKSTRSSQAPPAARAQGP